MLSLTESSSETIAYAATLAATLAAIPLIYYKVSKVKTNDKKKDPLTPVLVPVDPSFDWKTQKPYPYRPFKKGPYKMTMAIRKQDPNDFICIENTYLQRVKLREKVFEERKMYGFHESALEALKETYNYVFNHMLKRYPMYFKLSNDKKTITNSITDDIFPATPDNLEPQKMMSILNRNMEEDFLLLIKNPSLEDGYDEYMLRAAVSAFPSGFDPIEKVNQPLTKIHGPVPDYVKKLQLSMNKFFVRLGVHEYFVRNNWSIQTHTNLCAPTGSHATSEEAASLHPHYPQDLDFNKVFFRVEKQCFTRLPKSGADLMLIRTYTTSLMDLKESLNEEERGILCDAIDGLTGDFGVYKRRVIWGEAAKAFINGESNGSNPENVTYEFTG